MSHPLMIAAGRGRLDLIDLLDTAGADRHARTRLGLTALSNTGDGETAPYRAVIARLLEVGAKSDVEARFAAVRRGSREMIRLLVAAEVDVNAVCRRGTALHVAVDWKRADNVVALRAAGADPEQHGPDESTRPCSSSHVRSRIAEPGQTITAFTTFASSSPVSVRP